MSRRRKFMLGALTALVLGLALIGYGWIVQTTHAVDIGAGMLAKQVCSCFYLANRSLEDCRADQMASMDAIDVEILEDEMRVRAWVSGLGERQAFYRQGFGCTLE